MPLSTHVKDQIKKNVPTITHLDLSNRGLCDEDISELQELLQNAPYINSLDLSYNNLTSQSCPLLCLIPGLKSINLSHNHVDDKAISSLVKSKIKNLTLSYNAITEKGAKILLENVTQFNELNILGNPDIPANLLYQIRKHFIPDLPDFSNSPPIGLDLGMNVTTSQPEFFFSKKNSDDEKVKINDEKPTISNQSEILNADKRAVITRDLIAFFAQRGLSVSATNIDRCLPMLLADQKVSLKHRS